MAQINKLRQQMYLDGKVGVKYNGELEQLREITNFPFQGFFTFYYASGVTDNERKGVEYFPISWFYEEDATAKRSLWRLDIDIPEWEIKKGYDSINTGSLGVYFKTVRNLDIFIPYTILKFIATPLCVTKVVTLSNGMEVELSTEDIEKIKQL